MTRLIFTVFVLFSAIPASAALCSAEQEDRPCTPDPGPETTLAVKNIRKAVDAAHALDEKVAGSKAAYEAVRDNQQVSVEERLSACEKYRAYKTAQDLLFKQAIDKTAELYHVYPANRGALTVAKPTDPAMEWMSGLTAVWNPQPTESGEHIKLAFKIAAGDRDHYGGLVNMDPDPKDPDIDPRYAVTLPDGRTLILIGTIDLALQKKHGLGFLASIIFHEARHFDYLSRSCPDKSISCSWASETEDERDAYNEQKRLSRVFGLNKFDSDDFIEKWRQFDAEVKAGRLKSFNPSADQEALWQAQYPSQIDLEAEYRNLEDQVDAARRENEERRERERREEEYRQRQEDAKKQLLAAVYGQIQDCRFAPDYRQNGHVFSGFRTEINGWPETYVISHNMTLDEFKVGIMFARACLAVTMQGFAPDHVMPCNEGTAVADEHWSEPGFKEDAQFEIIPEEQARCVGYLHDHWTTPFRMDAFARLLSKAQKEYDRAVDDAWRRANRERQGRESADRSNREAREGRERNERESRRDDRHAPPPIHCGFGANGAYCN